MAPIQVRNDSSQPDVPAHETDNAADEKETSRTPEESSARSDNRSHVRTPKQAAEPSVCQSFHCPKFHSYDHYRNIPTRKQLIDGGYYAHLDQQPATPPTRDKKREDFKKLLKQQEGKLRE